MSGRVRSVTDLERFTEKYVVLPDGCWDWTSTTARGYATFSVDGRKVRASRWAYEKFIGPIPAGAELDHECHSRSGCTAGRDCRHRRCVNPAHLEPVTQLENNRRSRLSVCRSGRHDLTVEANIRWDARGRRRGCLVCWNEGQARRPPRSHAKKETI